MASKKTTKKVSKKASSSASASFAKDLEKLLSKHDVQPLTISSEVNPQCPPGTHPEMVPIQDASGNTVLVRMCVKDD